MTGELETGAAASLGGLAGGKGEAREPAPCPNCGERVAEEYCSQCGQLQKEFNRPLFGLVKNGLQDTFALDGRLMRTLPYLFFRPGRMTREYLDGKRARYVPPFRLFLLSSLIFFLTLFSVVKLGTNLHEMPAEPADIAEPEPEDAQPAPETSGATFSEVILRPDGSVDRAKLAEQVRSGSSLSPEMTERVVDFVDRAALAYENDTLFFTIVKSWAPRISFFQLPVFALLLGLLYVWRRGIVLYDHIITTLHLQSYFYLFSALLILIAVSVSPWFLLSLVFVPPAYIYRQLRVTYGDWRIMAGLRTIMLCVITLFILIVLMLVLVLTGLYQL